MSTFVLVHGAWHGGWCWERVVPLLRSDGHTVLTPTLTGLGERASELTREVGLHTHAQDVAGTLAEAAAPVVLVGHSYGGLVVREAADSAPDAVERIVLVDGWVGPDGTSMDTLAPDWFATAMRNAATDGWRIPPFPAAAVGVTEPADIAWLEPQLTPHPLRTFSEATTLTGAVDRLPGSAIICRPSRGVPFDAFAASVGYPARSIEAGHDAMVTAPAELARMLSADG